MLNSELTLCVYITSLLTIIRNGSFIYEIFREVHNLNISTFFCGWTIIKAQADNNIKNVNE